MPEFIADTEGTVAGTEWSDLSEFTQGYIECVLFTSTCSGISMVDWHDPDNVEDVREGRADGSIPTDTGFGDIAPDTLHGIYSDCQEFQTKARHLLSVAYTRDYDAAQAGRDFWYTRNHHGVGFWDRKELDRPGIALEDGSLGDQLTTIAHEFGEVNAWFSEEPDEKSPTGYGFMYLE